MPDPTTTTVSHFAEMVSTVAGAKPPLNTFKYRLMAPDEGKPNERFPLVIYLHGAGERGNDNRKQLLYLPEILAKPENRKRFPCYCFAPQCPTTMRWVEVPWDAEASTPQAPPSPAMQAVMTVLDDVLHTWPLDEKRIYLTGLSMGGYGTWDWALREPQRFAAVAPVCGGGDERKATVLKDVPLWAVHGDKDQAVPVGRTRTMIEAIRAAGGNPKYSELEGVGHNSWNRAYAPDFGLLDWMFAQKRA